MSDTPTPPEPGQPLWGDDLNTYLLSLEARIAANEGRITELESTVNEMADQFPTIDARLLALENAPEWVYNSYAWQFSNSAPPATGNQLRLNNTDATQATLIDVRLIDSDGSDRKSVFRTMAAGSLIEVSDWDAADTFHRYRATGPATIDVANAQIPVTWITGNGVIPNAKCEVGIFVDISSFLGLA